MKELAIIDKNKGWKLLPLHGIYYLMAETQRVTFDNAHIAAKQATKGLGVLVKIPNVTECQMLHSAYPPPTSNIPYEYEYKAPTLLSP